MKAIHENISYIIAIALFCVPISIFLVFGEKSLKWWWVIGYYVIFMILSLSLMMVKYSILQDIGRDMGRIFLKFSLGFTSNMTLIFFIPLLVLPHIGYEIPISIWVVFYFFDYAMGHRKFKEREETFVMLKKPLNNRKRFEEKLEK